ncbi:MAG TPA: SCO family protein [Candidatus Acidoferrum sp.]|nr:SCO family protein [Candidatus Acidoferrum sp.]
MRRVLTALVTAVLYFGSALGAPAAPAPAAARADPSAIRLIDQNDRPFTLRDLRGRPVLLTFVATRCTDACPIANAVFAELQNDLERRHVDARLLTVTLDPGNDTPFVMATAARRLGADPRRWRFASGSVPDVQRLLRAFDVVVEPDAQGIPDVHSTFVYLLDRDGHLSRSMLLSTTIRQEALAALAAQPPSAARPFQAASSK